jgi:hypothetical protein
MAGRPVGGGCGVEEEDRDEKKKKKKREKKYDSLISGSQL